MCFIFTIYKRHAVTSTTDHSTKHSFLSYTYTQDSCLSRNSLYDEIRDGHLSHSSNGKLSIFLAGRPSFILKPLKLPAQRRGASYFFFFLYFVDKRGYVKLQFNFTSSSYPINLFILIFCIIQTHENQKHTLDEDKSSWGVLGEFENIWLKTALKWLKSVFMLSTRLHKLATIAL